MVDCQTRPLLQNPASSRMVTITATSASRHAPGETVGYLKNSRRSFAEHELFRQPKPHAFSIVRKSE